MKFCNLYAAPRHVLLIDLVWQGKPVAHFQKPRARCQEIRPICTSPWPLSMAATLDGGPVIVNDSEMLT